MYSLTGSEDMVWDYTLIGIAWVRCYTLLRAADKEAPFEAGKKVMLI